MRSALTVVIALAGMSILSQHAKAQAVNCDALHNSPYMCLTNLSPYSVTGIQATSSSVYGSNWITIPGGPIPPGGTSIVQFPTGGWGTDCNKYVVIRTTGPAHVFPGVNVCKASRFIVRW